MSWTEHEQTTTLAMWDAGSSAKYIAETLGTKTRNAVIGWLNRKGISDSDRSVSHVMLLERRRRERSEISAMRRYQADKRRAEARVAKRLDGTATGRVTFMFAETHIDAAVRRGEPNHPLRGNFDVFGHRFLKRKLPKNTPYIPGPDGVTTLTVKAHQCRWPMSMDPHSTNHRDDAPDTADDHLCGADCTTHRSYCDHHASRAAKPARGEA